MPLYMKMSENRNETTRHLQRDYLMKTSIKINMVTDEGNSRNEIEHWTNDEIRVAVKVGSECKLNSWPDSSVD